MSLLYKCLSSIFVIDLKLTFIKIPFDGYSWISKLLKFFLLSKVCLNHPFFTILSSKNNYKKDLGREVQSSKVRLQLYWLEFDFPVETFPA